MGKNTGKGGKGYKKSKNNPTHAQQEIPIRGESQDYAIVTNLLGDGRLRVVCVSDGIEKLAIIRGSMRRRVWIQKEDFILVSEREFQDGRLDVIHKYSNDEARVIKRTEDISLKLCDYTNKAERKSGAAVQEEPEDDMVEFGSDCGSDLDFI